VGGGFLSGSTKLRLSEAWDFFGEANGVPSLDAMRAVIGSYRRRALEPPEDPDIGCILLRDVFFVDDVDSASPPTDFAGNIVSGKSYDLTSGSYLERVLESLLLHSQAPTSVPGPVFGDPMLVAPRLGQQAFKAVVLTAYQRRCAITGAKGFSRRYRRHIFVLCRAKARTESTMASCCDRTFTRSSIAGTSV